MAVDVEPGGSVEVAGLEQRLGDDVVESVDGVAGVGEHQYVDAVGVESGGVSGETFDGGVEVAVGVDAVVAVVGVCDVRVSVAKLECCVGFPGVGEAVEFGQVMGDGVGVVDEFGEHVAGADGAELLVVADEHGSPSVRGGELVVGPESGGVDHAGFVDDHDGAGCESMGGSGAVGLVVFVEELVDRVGSDAGTLGEFVRGASGRREPVDVDARPRARRPSRRAACGSCPTRPVRRRSPRSLVARSAR